MREIKFRVWCKNKNEWEQDEIAIKSNGMILHLSTKAVFPCMVKSETHDIQQFTGLKDKNGKEIYEGDILASMNNDFNPPYKYEWVVIYERGAFIADRADNQGETWMAYWTEKEFEVIGNIYENPINLDT